MTPLTCSHTWIGAKLKQTQFDTTFTIFSLSYLASCGWGIIHCGGVVRLGQPAAPLKRNFYVSKGRIPLALDMGSMSISPLAWGVS